MGHLSSEEGKKEIVVVEVEDDAVGEERENGSQVVKWERVLPKMALRVLLVEADDSTRQIVAALLRKCNYKVAAISDGLKAWEILKRRHSDIDLILTELDLPSISGYALLTLIMEHDGCKDFPVIIMSSQDSINMVLKCMLKGAADFLIKPVRKNELKNLWRHVWKRLSNDVGLIPQDPVVRQLNVEATFENNPAPASSYSGENVSSSMKNMKLSEKAADVQDLSQVNHKEEAVPNGKEANYHSSIVKLEDIALNISDTGERETNSVAGYGTKVSAASKAGEDRSSACFTAEDGSVDPGSHIQRDYLVGHGFSEPAEEAVDLIGQINKQGYAMEKSGSNGELNRLNSTPELELTLRRVHDSTTKDVDERHLLNHSSASAFSWYSSGKKLRGFFPSNDDLNEAKGSFETSAWAKACSSNEQYKPSGSSQSAHVRAVSPGPQTGTHPPPGAVIDGGVWNSYTSVFQPMYNTSSVPTARSPSSAFQRDESPFMTSPSLQSDPGTRSSTMGCGPDGEMTNQSSGQTRHEHKTRESVEQSSYSKSPRIGTSGSFTPCQDVATQRKSSACGSVSEVTDANATGPSATGTSALEESVKDEGSNTLDCDQLRPRVGHHSAEREAALAKFRLKRKGRCFEKKVRYQSRKRLAEQRPRVKGQFVRQAPTADPVLTDTDVDKP